MVLILDESNGLNVSDINPRERVHPTWKWRWGPGGRLVNVGQKAAVGLEYGSGGYYVHSPDGSARFQTRAHFYYRNEFAEHLYV